MKFLAGLLVIGAIVAKMCLFVVTEGEQAIITQFGDPLGDPITEAGLHFKVPFLHEARYVDKRILSWDGFPNQIPTKDKKYIKVDTTARWRIVDALKFIQTVRNETGAKTRLDAILDSATRDVISNHNLVEAVRNSNSIFESIEEKKKKVEADKKAGISEVEDDTTGEIESITKGRESLSEMIAVAAEKELVAFGIKLIDVQLKRISYEKTVEAKVYDRMISERQRVAQKIRSIGQGEKAKIEGRMQRDLQQIKSESYKQVQVIKGKGEAKAAAIYAKSLSKSPSFYEFMQTMDLYKDIFKKDTKFLLTSDSDLLKYLKSEN